MQTILQSNQIITEGILLKIRSWLINEHVTELDYQSLQLIEILPLENYHH